MTETADYILIVGHTQQSINGRVPVFFDGLSWRAEVRDTPIRAQLGDDAAAVSNHTIIGRGRIDDIESERDKAIVHVTP